MLLPLATLLSYIGSDMRHDAEQRSKALRLLKMFDTQFCIGLGLSADWGLVRQSLFCVCSTVLSTTSQIHDDKSTPSLKR